MLWVLQWQRCNSSLLEESLELELSHSSSSGCLESVPSLWIRHRFLITCSMLAAWVSGTFCVQHISTGVPDIHSCTLRRSVTQPSSHSNVSIQLIASSAHSQNLVTLCLLFDVNEHSSTIQSTKGFERSACSCHLLKQNPLYKRSSSANLQLRAVTSSSHMGWEKQAVNSWIHFCASIEVWKHPCACLLVICATALQTSNTREQTTHIYNSQSQTTPTMQTFPTAIDSLEDITIERVDFEWIRSCVKVSHLKRAIRVIEADGDYYPQLKEACFQRLEELDPTLKKQVFNNNISTQAKEQLNKDLEEWQNQMDGNIFSNMAPVQYADNISAEEYFNRQENKKAANKMTPESKARLAESERNKGNEAIKSKDFDEAISFYTKSLGIDVAASTYCNRALAYLKKNQFDKVIKDCTDCLGINPKYTKAFHRRSKAYLGLKNKVRSYYDLKEALTLEPNNNELNGELKELRDQMTKEELGEVDTASKEFKRITIEEDSEQQQEIESLS